MIKASNDLQDLRRRLYVKAKSETSWRFWGLYVHVCKMETLRKAYALAEDNDGAPGVDGVEETSASCEARSAPRSYPTEGGRLPPATRWRGEILVPCTLQIARRMHILLSSEGER